MVSSGPQPTLGVETSSLSNPLLGAPADCGNSVHPVVAFNVTLPARISGSRRQEVPPAGQEQPAALEVLHWDDTSLANNTRAKTARELIHDLISVGLNALKIKQRC